MNNNYHYTQCGLDYVHLKNGFTVEETAYGKAVSFDNIQGLDRAIAEEVSKHVGTLSGQEVRYIRSYMDMAQTKLASLIGKKDAQPVANWEKGKTPIPDTENFLLLHIFRQYLSSNSNYVDMINELNEREKNEADLSLSFEDTNNGWFRSVK